MKGVKFTAIAIIISLMSMTLSGCADFFSGIPKDTVMVKEIPQEKPGDVVEYNGVLSEETVKTLSMNAVNKYFENNLSLDDIQFEMYFMDQQGIKSLLADATQNVDRERGFLVEYKEPLKKVASGIYMATVLNIYDPSDVYGVVINAKDGEVLGLSKVNDLGKTMSKNELSHNQLVGYADEFVKDIGDYKLSDLQLGDNFYYRGSVEFYYTKKGTDEVVLSVMLNAPTGQTVGFYKDMMTVLQFLLNKVKMTYMYEKNNKQ
ncbi:hypothetical protein [Paenibacillus paeoniae]|uniref:Lipoprotein n=1 Tax=Paenibacillus paeoniae TaxID=2292705 RepID=A0A371PHK7_9BACL|nr:hypothetical protein [Paenibacillus paeoniae]REK75008.1 hypothetical protein DX130_15330 [Paenibacillus paeoniae]